jgi:hypothetical protein
VTRWFRCSLSVADSFVCRCLNKRLEMKLKRQAKQLGYQLVPIEPKAA